MSASWWLFPDDNPVGPWLCAELLLDALGGCESPVACFRREASPETKLAIEKRGITCVSLGRSGANLLGVLWSLRGKLRERPVGRLHVWDTADLPLAVAAICPGIFLSCEVHEAQKCPRLFDWWPSGLERVNNWLCRGQIKWVRNAKETPVSGVVSFPRHLPQAFKSLEEGSLRILLIADSPRAIREGLWAFDIFRHAWLGARLEILSVGPNRDAAAAFGATLALGGSLGFSDRWPEFLPDDGPWAVVVLGHGPWIYDAALRALSLGAPVVVESSPSVAKAIVEGAPLVSIAGGDRAGLAAALQRLVTESGQLEQFHEEIRTASLGAFSLAKALTVYGNGQGRQT